MKILVTGGAGFLGAALVRRLLTDGHNVGVLDNVGKLEHHARLRCIVGSVTRADEARQAFYVGARDVDVVDAVFHLAAINGTAKFYGQPERVLEVGLRGTENVLDACRQLGVRQLVYFSSSEVYNEAKVFPTPEDVPLVVPDVRNPRFSYSISKIAGEAMVLHASHLTKAIVVRPHNVYGPSANPLHVIPQTIAQLLSQSFPNLDIQGDGSQTRSFIHVEDFVDGVLLAWEKGDHGQVYNVGSSGDEISMMRLKEKVAMLMGYDPMLISWRRTIAPHGSPRRRCPDVSKLRTLGRFEPRSLGVGLAQTVNWYLAEARKGQTL